MLFNSSGNNITEEPNLIGVESKEFRIVKIAFYVVIFVLSCLGNSLVAIVITRSSALRNNSSNVFIVNLAICDLLLPATSIPFDLVFEEMNLVWPFGKVMCKLLWPCETALSTASSLTLSAISLDRYRALAKPLSVRFSSGQTRACVVVIHVLSSCVVIPYVLALSYNSVKRDCSETWPADGYRQAYTMVLFIFQYALPLIIMCACYTLIYWSLRTNIYKLFSRKDRSVTERNRELAQLSITSSALSHNTIEMRRKEQNIRLAKMFVIVVLVFAISTFPNQVLWLWVDFGNGGENPLFPLVSVLCRLFTYANSVLNPFIYALKSKEFRSGYAKIGRKTIEPLRKLSDGTRKLVSFSRNKRSRSSSSGRGPPESSCNINCNDSSRKRQKDSEPSLDLEKPARKIECHQANTDHMCLERASSPNGERLHLVDQVGNVELQICQLNNMNNVVINFGRSGSANFTNQRDLINMDMFNEFLENIVHELSENLRETAC